LRSVEEENSRLKKLLAEAMLDCGRRFRFLCVVDDYTRECLTLVAETSLSGDPVARELTSLVGSRGKRNTVVNVNGPELTSSANASNDQTRQSNDAPR
jgi:putative transposase